MLILFKMLKICLLKLKTNFKLHEMSDVFLVKGKQQMHFLPFGKCVTKNWLHFEYHH